MPRTHSIALRLVAAAILWIAATLIAGGLLLSNLFQSPLQDAFEQRLSFLLQNLISVTEFKPDGTIAEMRPLGEPRFLAQYSGLYWQIGRLDEPRILARSRSMWDFEIAIASDRSEAKSRRTALKGPLGQRLIVIEHMVSEDGVPGTYVFAVAADTAELVSTVEEFNLTLIWSLGVLGIGLVMAVLAQVYIGLSPLKRIRVALADIRGGRAERLEGDFPKEVLPLADELNGLLDHTSQVLARARAHVGNLAHALKTPLAVLTNEGNAPTKEIAATVYQQADLMRRHIDHHLTRARAIGQAPLLRSQTELRPVLRAVARTLGKIYQERGIKVGIAGGDGLAFRGEQHDLEEMLGNLVDNGCKWARSEVQLTAEALTSIGSGGLQVSISVDDDGPGVAADLRDGLFDRGHRGDPSKPGSGLGLSIVRDIATLYGGVVELADSPVGGLRAKLILPGAVIEGDGNQGH